MFHCFTSACDPGGRRHNLNIFTLESSRPPHVITPSPRAVPAPSASLKRSDISKFESTTKKLFQLDSTLQHHPHSSIFDQEAREQRSTRLQTFPQRFCNVHTSCFDDDELLLPIAASSTSTTVTRLPLTFPRRPKVHLFSSSRPQRPVNDRLDNEPLQHHSNAAADISGTADSIDSKLNSQSYFCLHFTLISTLLLNIITRHPLDHQLLLTLKQQF